MVWLVWLGMRYGIKNIYIYYIPHTYSYVSHHLLPIISRSFQSSLWPLETFQPWAHRPESAKTVDGSEIPRPTTIWMYENPVNNGMNYQPRLVSRISEPSTVCVLCVCHWLISHNHSDSLQILTNKYSLMRLNTILPYRWTYRNLRTRSGFAIITWNNLENWRTPIFVYDLTLFNSTNNSTTFINLSTSLPQPPESLVPTFFRVTPGNMETNGEQTPSPSEVMTPLVLQLPQQHPGVEEELNHNHGSSTYPPPNAPPRNKALLRETNG